jgi:hypothetical protein
MALREGAAEGIVGDMSLHPGGEDFDDSGVVAAVEDVLHPPEVQRVVSVVEGPEESTEMNAAVGVGVLGDGVGQHRQRGLGGLTPILASLDFSGGLEGRGGQEGFQQVAYRLGRSLVELAATGFAASSRDGEEVGAGEPEGGTAVAEGVRGGPAEALVLEKITEPRLIDEGRTGEIGPQPVRPASACASPPCSAWSPTPSRERKGSWRSRFQPG